MARLVDADEAYKVLTDYYHQRTEIQHKALKEAFSRVPIADATFMRYGHWVVDEDGNIKCSECGYHGVGDNYCERCGAKMDKDEWEEPEINPCRGCVDYDGRGGCKSNGGCGIANEIN